MIKEIKVTMQKSVRLDGKVYWEPLSITHDIITDCLNSYSELVFMTKIPETKKEFTESEIREALFTHGPLEFTNYLFGEDYGR